MKKKEIRILYDDTNFCELTDRIRRDLFEEMGQYEDWTSVNEVPDYMVYDELNTIWQDEYDQLKERLDRMFDGSYYLLTGECGRWNGRFAGGLFVTNFEELMKCINHLDSMTVTDIDGHLIIDGYHHDGSDHYELKKLTHKGYQYAYNNYFANDRDVHNTIFNCNIYSKLPRAASL